MNKLEYTFSSDLRKTSHILDIVLGFSNDGELFINDKSDYSDLGDAIFEYVIVDRVVDIRDNEAVPPIIREINVPSDIKKVKNPAGIPIPYDGIMIVQRILVPKAPHADTRGTSIYYDSEEQQLMIYDDYAAGSTMSLSDFMKRVHETDNVRWFSDRIFVNYWLLHCFLEKEQARLDKILANGCGGLCAEKDNGLELLTAAILLIDVLIENDTLDTYLEAQSIIDRINACGGLCKNTKSANECGCNG